MFVYVWIAVAGCQCSFLDISNINIYEKDVNFFYGPHNNRIVVWVYATVFHILVHLICHKMTYKKECKTVAGRDYVSEVTKWPGHKYTKNIPVYYG